MSFFSKLKYQAQTLLNRMISLIIANDVDTPPIEKSNIDFQPSLEEVEAILGYKFKDKQLLVQAFTHSSYCVENSISYERLEYIGDSVLNFLTSKEQFLLYPDMDPGHLTRLRAANVDTEKLARVAIKHGLHLYMRHQKPLFEEKIEEFKKEILEYPLHSNGLIDVPKCLADIVESSIGAVFDDCGSTDIVWKVFKSMLEPRIDPNNIQKHPVTELYEICQKKNLKIEFQDLWDESKMFNVVINEKLVGRAKYGSKKGIAQGRAAKNALNNMEKVLNLSNYTNEDAIVD